MPVNSDAIGKKYPVSSYAVGREKVREYAHAVGETNQLYLNVEAARAAGYVDVVAPPMFAVVYQGRAITPALFDPDVGIDFPRMLHGGQEFRWGELVVAGDEIDTTTTRQGHLHAGRDELLRIRDRFAQPAGRDRVHRALDEHREGRLVAHK